MALAAVVTACAGGKEARGRFLSIGTGGTGGIYYPLGGALASRLSEADSSHEYTAEVTGGSVENVNRILAGQIDLGFALSVTIYKAYHGSADFPVPDTLLRIVAPMYPNVTQILVPASSSARSLADLRGKKISVGSAGSGTEEISRELLQVYGLSYDDIEPRYLSFTESAAALKDGAIDAAILSVGVPAAAVLDATTTGGARLLGVAPDKLAALQARHPYYSAGEIPAQAYPGVSAPISTVAMMNWVVGRADLDPGVVRTLLEILQNDRDSLARVHEMARQIDLARLAEAPIPLHAAAVAWRAGR